MPPYTLHRPSAFFLVIASVLTCMNTFFALKSVMYRNALIDHLHEPGEQTQFSFGARVGMIFEANDRYNMTSDEDWNSLMPGVGHESGFIQLGTPSSPGTVVQPSLYHQLHCLNDLRRSYMTSYWENQTGAAEHVHRCINVLRQAVLCNADTTLEPSREIVDESGHTSLDAPGIDHVLHMCRDWAKMRRGVEENYRVFGGHGA